MNAVIIMSLLAVTADPAKPDEKKILEALQGEWVVEKVENNGEEFKDAKGMKITIEKNKTIVTMKDVKKESTFKIDVTKSPMEMDNYDDGKISGKAIFEIDGDTLRMCGGGAKSSSTFKDGKVIQGETILDDRPAKFDSKLGALVTLKRVKK